MPDDGHVREVSRYSDADGDSFAVPVAPDGSFRALLPSGERYRIRMLGTKGIEVDAVRTGDTATASLPATPPPARQRSRSWTWITANTVSFAHGEAGHGTDDLAALDAIVGDARIVGLGEATHGSHEMFAIENRLVEYLVARRGSRSSRSKAASRYPGSRRVLQGGAGNPAIWLSGSDGSDAEEIAALVEWLRAWNAHAPHDRKVHLIGIDMQDQAPVPASSRSCGGSRRGSMRRGSRRLLRWAATSPAVP